MIKYNFDGHKLMYHPDRVAQYLADGDCYPLYMEISPVGVCNHRCIFCAYDFIGYPNRKLERERTLLLLDELAECGLKSILFAGEGEPLIHPDIAEFILRARDNGIDVGLFTNGQLLKKELAEVILPALTFIRFSFNGGNRDNYAAIHSVHPDAFDTVVENIREAVLIKRQASLQADIGAQFVLIPENSEYILAAAETIKDCGADYLAIKPFIQRELQSYQLQLQFSNELLEELLSSVENIAGSSFNVIARRDTFQNYGVRNYDHCYGASFITVLNSAGVISTCLPYWEQPEFSFGSIYEHTFKGIWNSDRRKSVKAHLECTLDTHGCPPNCRPNAVNEFLSSLKYPQVKHINFI
ncbi:MAG: radical SAM protein [Desulfuromonadaceae bacterium]|nr:radical SAM protein [Desulfuromonadaceae bacterium]